MADTTTTNLGLTKPEIGASANTWGTKLNADLDAIDALFPSGDLAVVNGGTGSSTASGARTNLGLVIGTNVAAIASPAFTGTPTAPTAASGTNTTQIATTAFVQAALQAVYPVGSIYINAASTTNPATLLGFGTWSEFGAGKVIVGQDTGDALFDTLQETGGSKDAIVVSHTHTATVTDPGHNHTLSGREHAGASGTYNEFGDSAAAEVYSNTTSVKTATTGISVSNSTTGSSGTNANLQPYIVVKMWRRTA